MTPSIEFKGVSKFFGNIIALKDISFKVFKGEITALLGDNGAGKSALIKLLSGVHMPSEGAIFNECNQKFFSRQRNYKRYFFRYVSNE